MKKAWIVGGLFVVTVGCGGAAAQQPPVTPASAASGNGSAALGPEATPPPDPGPWALPEWPRDPKSQPNEVKDVRTEVWAKASKVKGLPQAPASCAALAKPAVVKPAPTDLSVVLLEKDTTKRNAMLFAIETAKPEVALTIRAMRAELAPIECADAITDPALSAASVQGVAGQMTVGLSLASKLSRTAANAPAMKDASDKEKVKRFIQGPLRQWMVEQASAIDALSAPASELTGLARGVVAVEAGMADLRLVDRIRSSPTPSSWDKELKAVYEAALDEALEPRKVRGRDAALVGLADFAAAGVVHDARIDRARGLLSKLYGGRRIDALDALLLPASEPDQVAGIPESVLLLVSADPAKREPFAQLLARAFPVEAPSKSARARPELGRRYWRRVDVVEAAHAVSKDASPEARLVLAVSLAVAKGPNGPKEMMSAPSPQALGLTDTRALDALVIEAPTVAGMAAYDAAHIRSLSPPEGDPAGPYLADVAARFRKAAALLEDPAQRKRAEERAADAEAASKAAGDGKPPAVPASPQ
ncbi:MAG: hypothetical protein J0I07_34100 [Myxococcales bacterium]|nr:hypothetical protein [Myxococcales bacterium]